MIQRTHAATMMLIALTIIGVPHAATAGDDGSTWTGSFDERWERCDNWDPSNLIPGLVVFCNMVEVDGRFADATINGGGGDPITTSVNGTIVLNTLTVQGGSVDDPALLIQSPMQLYGASSLGGTQIASNVEAFAAVTIEDGCNWTRGTLFGPSPYLVPAATLPIGSLNVTRGLSGTTLFNGAEVTQFGGLALDDGAVVDNDGIWTLGNGVFTGSVGLVPGGSGTFRNIAEIRTNLAGQTSTFDAALDNAGGTITVADGTVAVQGGGTHTGGTWEVDGGGVLNFRGSEASGTETHVAGNVFADGVGTVRLSGDFVVDPGASLTFDLGMGETGAWLVASTSSAVIQARGPIINSGLMRLGLCNITGDATNGALRNAPTGVVRIVGGSPTFTTWFYNEGFVKQETDLFLGGANIKNEPNSEYELIGGGIFPATPGSSKIVCRTSELIKPTESLGNSIIGVPLDLRSGGKLRVDEDAVLLTDGGEAFDNGNEIYVSEDAVVALAGGEFDVDGFADDALKIEGSGEFKLQSAAVLDIELGGAVANLGDDFAPGAFRIEGGTLAGAGESGPELRNQGELWWTGGTVAIGAHLRNAAGGRMHLDANNVLEGRVTNDGCAEHLSNGLQINDGLFQNNGCYEIWGFTGISGSAAC